MCPRRLLPQETWLSYRKIIQAWDESICKVAAKDLPKADYDMLAEAVLTGKHMDAEILCVLNRRPRVFHLRMLPTCAVEVGSDEVAADIAKAHVEAAAAKLKLFEAELRSDWATLREAEAAKQQLKELLHWLDLEHRRTQAALGEALVAKRMAKTHPVVQVEGWDKLASQLGLVVRSWDADSPDCPRRAILWLDFNTPHARDSLRMPALAAAMGNAARVLGPENTIICLTTAKKTPLRARTTTRWRLSASLRGRASACSAASACSSPSTRPWPIRQPSSIGGPTAGWGLWLSRGSA